MINVDYVEKELKEIDTNTLASLHFWCEGLIKEIRELESTAVKTTLAIDAYKHMVEGLQDRMSLAYEALNDGDSLLSKALLRYELDKNEDQ